MKTRVGLLGAAMGLAIGFSTLTADAAASSAKRGGNVNQNLVEMTRSALQVEDVLEKVVYLAYTHDGKIGEAVKGNYEILPKTIIPWSISDGNSVSVVKVETTKGGIAKMYTFAFIFSEEGLQLLLLYPGGSNADPTLFSDVLATATGVAQAALSSEEVNIKDTRVLGQITTAGWAEEWLWVNEKGETYKMEIAFSTGAPGQGTDWEIRGARK